MVWKCPLCKKVITVVTPYVIDGNKVIECCYNCAKERNLKVAVEKIWIIRRDGIQIPNWKADIGVIIE